MTDEAHQDLLLLRRELFELRREVSELRRRRAGTRPAIVGAALLLMVGLSPASSVALELPTDDIADSMPISADAMRGRFESIGAAVTALETFELGTVSGNELCTQAASPCSFGDAFGVVVDNVVEGQVVRVELSGGTASIPGAGRVILADNGDQPPGNSGARLVLERRPTDVVDWEVAGVQSIYFDGVGNFNDFAFGVPCSSISFLDDPGEGAFAYRLTAIFGDVGNHPEQAIEIQSCRLVASTFGRA